MFPGSGSAGTNGAIHMNQMTVCYSDFLPDLWVVLIYSEIETILLYLSSPSPSSVGSKIGSQQLNWIFLISLLVWFNSGLRDPSKHVVHFNGEDITLLSNRRLT